ncbi:hypothetical protein FJ930_13090 [Mesorhizobium sp. B2-4-15]|uniref:hypothetical protein n=1 Tax=unclassified Mesorhizobium TaxID=325217 RepID=UPI001128E86E|nr:MULTISPECIES: hypothetical protein [unclassified Mesorhizobium]TPK72098.1 hypothetical protein FJ930_13090 [Mesorhizobium sp. B2-4-15]TPM26939.1 hypothetical protein FJ958_19045 [Mesorhizobium sp. B2-3-5]
MRSRSVNSGLGPEIVERPGIGIVRVVGQIGDDNELPHLAESREAAELWLAKTGYRNVRLEEVTADEVGADVAKGRVAGRAA